jgi:branched-chain amino acid transport system permease protein
MSGQGSAVLEPEEPLAAEPEPPPPATLRELAGMGARRWLALALLSAAIVVAALIPQLTDDQYVLDVLSQAGLFVLLAMGLNIVVALAGLLDLGYIAFWAVGAYTVAFFASPHFGVDVPTLPLLVIVVLVTSLFAVVIGFPTLRLRGDYLAIVTLGFGEIVRIALLNGGRVTGGASGIQAIDPPSIPGVTFSYQLEPYYYLVLAACVIGLIVGYLIRTSRLGIVWQVLRDDEIAAKALGIRPLRYYLLAFAIGAAFGGVSGALFAFKQTAVSPDSFTVDQSFLVLAIVVLGGLSGRFWPVAVSALVVVALPEVLRGLQEYRLVVFGPVLVGVVILRTHAPAVRARLVRWRGTVPGRRRAGSVEEGHARTG